VIFVIIFGFIIYFFSKPFILIGNTLNQYSQGIIALTAILGLLFGQSWLDTSKKKMKGKLDYDVARKYLKMVLQLRDAIKNLKKEGSIFSLELLSNKTALANISLIKLKSWEKKTDKDIGTYTDTLKKYEIAKENIISVIKEKEIEKIENLMDAEYQNIDKYALIVNDLQIVSINKQLELFLAQFKWRIVYNARNEFMIEPITENKTLHIADAYENTEYKLSKNLSLFYNYSVHGTKFQGNGIFDLIKKYNVQIEYSVINKQIETLTIAINKLKNLTNEKNKN
jgi:hypothetical protein